MNTTYRKAIRHRKTMHDRKTMHQSRMLLFALALIASCAWVTSARAESSEEDPSTRFHEAYVNEVIEGNVKEAAAEYLLLLQTESTPAKIRGEATFRFAVCTVLLGRSDEGAARLREIVADESMTKELRARAGHYLKGIENVGVGSATDKEMGELVKELALLSPDQSYEDESLFKVYRSIELMGDKAVPALRDLLKHRDRPLRRHAYRLLCRLNVSNLIPHYSVDLYFKRSNGTWDRDVRAYLLRKSTRLSRFGNHLLSLGKSAIPSFVVASGYPLDVIRQYVDIGGDLTSAAEDLKQLPKETARNEFVKWYRSDNEKKKMVATINLRPYLGPEIADIATELLDRHVSNSYDPDAQSGKSDVDTDISILAEHVPTQTIKGQLTRLLDRCLRESAMNWRGEQVPTVLALARVLKSRDAESNFEFSRVVETLRRYVDACDHPRLLGWVRDVLRRSKAHLVFHEALDALPLGESINLVEWLSSRSEWSPKTLLTPTNDDWRDRSLPLNTVRQVSQFLAGMRKTYSSNHNHSGDLSALYRVDKVATHEGMSLDVARLWLSAWPEASKMRNGRDNSLDCISVPMALAFQAIPEEEIGPAWLTCIQASAFRSYGNRQLLVHGCTIDGDQVAFPEPLVWGPKYWEELPAKDRKQVIARAVRRIEGVESQLQPCGSPDGVSIEDAAAILLERAPGAQDNHKIAETMSAHPSLFPCVRWLEFASSASIKKFPRERDAELESAVRVLVLKQGKLTPSLVHALRYRVSKAVAEEITASLLASPDSETRRQALIQIPFPSNARPATSQMLRECLALEIGAEPRNMAILSRLASLLLVTQPGKELFPLARVFLQSNEPGYVTEGIKIASSLGHDELVPDLRKLLSSLDARIRRKAAEALEEIKRTRALQRAERDAAGAKVIEKAEASGGSK